jgi:hypothetical protein
VHRQPRSRSGFANMRLTLAGCDSTKTARAHLTLFFVAPDLPRRRDLAEVRRVPVRVNKKGARLRERRACRNRHCSSRPCGRVERTSGARGRRRNSARLLAAASGYRVLASDGTHPGWLDHVRYERHAGHPDEVVVRSRRLLATRRRVFPFRAVAEVKQGERTLVLRGTRTG